MIRLLSRLRTPTWPRHRVLLGWAIGFLIGAALMTVAALFTQNLTRVGLSAVAMILLLAAFTSFAGADDIDEPPTGACGVLP